MLSPRTHLVLQGLLAKFIGPRGVQQLQGNCVRVQLKGFQGRHGDVNVQEGLVAAMVLA